MKPEPRVARKLLRSWLIQGIGWYARDEVAARGALELGFAIILLASGVPWPVVIASSLAFHTVAWILLYGGFLRVWVVLGIPSDVEALRAYLTEISNSVVRRPFIRAAFVRGSGARGELGPRSDLDVCLVPEAGASERMRGILFLWALRLRSVVDRKPVEARWIDYEKYIPYHVINETPRFLKQPRPESPEGRLRTRGLLVAVSGIDGSGKTTATRTLLARLRAKGVDAAYFYGHRQSWLRFRTGYQLSFAIAFESLWKRIGKDLADLRRYGFPRTVYAIATILDYVYVIQRLSVTMRGSRVVVTDRYVADVLAYLRSWGPLRITLEGFLVGMSPGADLAVLFGIEPDEALKRKREWDLVKLESFLREYSELLPVLRLRTVDAGQTPDQVADALADAVRDELRLPA